MCIRRRKREEKLNIFPLSLFLPLLSNLLSLWLPSFPAKEGLGKKASRQTDRHSEKAAVAVRRRRSRSPSLFVFSSFLSFYTQFRGRSSQLEREREYRPPSSSSSAVPFFPSARESSIFVYFFCIRISSSSSRASGRETLVVTHARSQQPSRTKRQQQQC